jgi:putative membrane protein
MVNFLIRLVVNAFALWVAATYIPGPPGIAFSDDSIPTILLVALVFGLVNAFLKPIVKLLSLPVRIVTLGLFSLVINTAMLALTAGIVEEFSIDGFVSAFIGALVISVIGAVAGLVIPDKD